MGDGYPYTLSYGPQPYFLCNSIAEPRVSSSHIALEIKDIAVVLSQRTKICLFLMIEAKDWRPYLIAKSSSALIFPSALWTSDGLKLPCAVAPLQTAPSQ